MQFFDRPSGRSKINLGGSSSRSQSSQQILADAKRKREQRALLRRQHAAATTVQRLIRRRATVHALSPSVPTSSTTTTSTTTISSQIPPSHPQHHLASNSTTPPALSTADDPLLRLVVLAGLVDAGGLALSDNIAIVQNVFHARPFVIPLAHHLCTASSDLNFDNLATRYPAAYDSLLVKAVVILLALAAHLIEGNEPQRSSSSSVQLASDGRGDASGNFEFEDGDRSLLLVVNAARDVYGRLTHSSLRLQAVWALPFHLARLLRLSFSHAHLSLADELRRAVSEIADVMIDHTVRVRDTDVQASSLGTTQLAFALLSVDRALTALDLLRRPEVVAPLIRSLVDTYPPSQSSGEGDGGRGDDRGDGRGNGSVASADNSSPGVVVVETQPFRWNVIHSLSDLSIPHVAYLLSNVIQLADKIAKNNSRWPFIAVISTLIRALPKDVLRLTSSNDLDDDDIDTDVVMEAVNETASDDMRLDAATLRSVMARVGSSLDQMMSAHSVRNLFSAAVAEGHHALLLICGLFDFLTLRDRKMEAPLRDALSLWRVSDSKGAPHILSSLWSHCTTISSGGDRDARAVGATTPEGIVVLRPDSGPILSIFSATYAYLLYIQDADEIFESSWPFSVEEVRVVASLLKQQLFHALYTRNSRTADGSNSLASPGRRLSGNGVSLLRSEKGLLDVVTKLVSRLHAVDSQRRFTVSDNFWEAGHGALASQSFLHDAFLAGPEALAEEVEETSVSGVSQMRYDNSRQGARSGAGEMLRVAPYLVPFSSRSKVFQSWIAQERDRVNDGPAVLAERTVVIRRQHIFDDAYAKLNWMGENLRATVRVKFVDEHGMLEAGIDGGGMFKEFMYEVLRLGFSPTTYGLFQSTSDGQLYPNPDAPIAMEDFKAQFAFLGRLLGKAVFDSVLVDVPLAKFFRLKMLGAVNYPTDLASLDPEVYKSIKYLKSCPAETVEDLGLTFTVVNNAFGVAKEVELKRNGRNIAVTANNRIEYIHRLAHYRMNQQIKEQSDAFLSGFYEIVPSHFVGLFSHEELQLLISGKGGQIDLDDWRRNTRYSGGYTEETPVIGWFWTAVAELNGDDQAKMLQFVTSCPRAPLLGFAYLVPGFCIHRAEGHVRLPTASTCMNLFKLPEYQSLDVVRQKLKYALQANAGFDLS